MSQVGFKFFAVSSMILFLDAIISMRYVYIFVLKNPAAFNDDFWQRFTTFWIFSCTSILTFTAFFKIRCQSLALNICDGTRIDQVG